MKSHVSDLLELAVCILKDATAKCITLQLDVRDVETLTSRVKHEGISFLTISLPALGSDFDKSLSAGRIEPTFFQGFRKKGKAPAFLQGFFAHVFDTSTGRILNEPDVSAIEGIRQIANVFKKLKLPCAPHRVFKAFQKFREDELDLQECLPQDLHDYFNHVSSVLWSGLCCIDDFNTHKLLPKHGPGATAERISGNRKYVHKRWHDRLEPYFPMLEYCFHNENGIESSEFEKVTIIAEADEQPVRVITVPKTLKSPRIIAIEPVCMQYTQQAISRFLMKNLESYWLTAGHVNFRDQSINQQLAISSSVDCQLATIDMSSASDRVPLSLVTNMFSSYPDLQDSILACRSKTAQLPSGEVIHLKKFASMGSALCFPVESMYFYTICIAALLRKYKLPVTSRNIYNLSRDVYVYGDDIIIPTDSVNTVMDYLQKYYCKVNMDKSHWTGKFRESCGIDAYNGEVVTPTYIRNTRPHDRRNSSALVSWVATSNQLYKRGYWLTSSHMLNICESILGKLPVVGPKCAGLGKVSFQHYVSSERWNRKYQHFEVKCWTARPVYRTDKLDGYPALMKSLLKLENPEGFQADQYSPFPVDADGNHLIRSARHGAVALQRRWTRPY